MNSWSATDSQRTSLSVDASKAAEYDKARDEGLPVVTKEAESGVKPVEPLRFQAVKSPGIYEAEFAKKERDLIFHFWPWEYHKAEHEGRPTPAFKKDFYHHITETAASIFGAGRFELKDDTDMGAIFLQAFGWGESDGYRQIAIRFCEEFHKAMGGEPG
jgi:hypothetical protein